MNNAKIEAISFINDLNMFVEDVANHIYDNQRMEDYRFEELKALNRKSSYFRAYAQSAPDEGKDIISTINPGYDVILYGYDLVNELQINHAYLINRIIINIHQVEANEDVRVLTLMQTDLVETLCTLASYLPDGKALKDKQQATKFFNLIEAHKRVLKDFIKRWYIDIHNEEASTIAYYHDETATDKHPPTSPALPKELNTDEARAVLNKAIENDLINIEEGFYRWNTQTYSKQLLAYFVEQMSNTFNLSKRYDAKGNKTVNWKLFEAFFDTRNLKSAKNDWMKVNTMFTPNRYEEIDALFQ